MIRLALALLLLFPYDQINVRVYAAEFAGSDKDSLEFFQESMDGLVKALFEQIPQ